MGSSDPHDPHDPQWIYQTTSNISLCVVKGVFISNINRCVDPFDYPSANIGRSSLNPPQKFHSKFCKKNLNFLKFNKKLKFSTPQFTSLAQKIVNFQKRKLFPITNYGFTRFFQQQTFISKRLMFSYRFLINFHFSYRARKRNKNWKQNERYWELKFYDV